MRCGHDHMAINVTRAYLTMAVAVPLAVRVYCHVARWPPSTTRSELEVSYMPPMNLQVVQIEHCTSSVALMYVDHLCAGFLVGGLMSDVSYLEGSKFCIIVLYCFVSRFTTFEHGLPWKLTCFAFPK